MARTSESTVARAEIARQNEQQVLAEASIRGARIVSWVRLAMCLLASSAMGLVPAVLGQEDRDPRDPLAGGAVVLYLLFSVGTVIALRRVKASSSTAGHAIRAGTIVMLIDFAFPLFMALRAYQMGAPPPPMMGAAGFGLTLCYSLAMYHWLQVVLATGLATTCFLALAAYTSQFQLEPCLYVVGVYVSMGLLFARMNRRIRNMFLDLRRRDNLTRFLAPEIAEEVMRLGHTALAPVQREVTVLFSDIRNFTSLSETLPPEAVLKFLDEYFGHMTQLVKGHHGIVNKFLGDGMLAFWNVPSRHDEHAVAAVRAALDMRKVLEEINSARAAVGAPPIGIGIGIHTGVVAAGMLGGADQHEYTVIGDAVNVASRVEGLTKVYGVDLLVSQSTWDLVKDRFVGERAGEEQVKGRAERVVVYAVRAPAPRADAAGSAGAAA